MTDRLVLALIFSALNIFGWWVEWINLKRLSHPIPEVMRDLYKPEDQSKSLAYHSALHRLGLIREVLNWAGLLALLFLPILPRVDRLTAEWIATPGASFSPLVHGMLYLGVLSGISRVVALPFEWIHTFKIESRFGFNRTTPQTFWLDRVKGVLLGVILGGGVVALIFWIYQHLGHSAWWIAWMSLTGIQLFFFAFGPSIILPLFYKLTDVPEGPLKQGVLDYAHKQDFPVRGIYQIDGSRRSTKANAFFTGLGKTKKIVLFDTLLQKLTPEELVGVLAHEVGHYRKKHIPKQFILSILNTGLFFWLFSMCLESPRVFAIFGFDQPSLHTGLTSFALVFGPASRILQLIPMTFSRRYEFQADAFAHMTTGQSAPLVQALKKLSTDHLAHLDPHPLKVFLDYSHPPTVQRLEALNTQ